MSRLILVLVITRPAYGGEYAILSSSLRIHVDRHEPAGDIVHLYNQDGSLDLPATMIAAFEQDDYVPPPPPPAPDPLDAKQPETPKPAPAPPPIGPQEARSMVRAAAVRSGLPSAFVESVAKAESGFNPKAVSPKGALGVMQLMPGTARTLDANPNDPAQNIEAGARLLRELLVKYSGDVSKALAAYNAGEGAVDRYNGVPPYSETQRYVNKVVRDYLKTEPAR